MGSSGGNEERGLSQRYGERRGEAYSAKYSPFDPANLLATEQRARLVSRELLRRGHLSLAGLDILDVGCGSGTELLRLLPLGADPRRLHGIELLDDRASAARERHPHFDITTGSAAQMPWSDESMDIVTQMTAFSSILDDSVRAAAAHEMARVLRPNGLIIWYDFTWNRPGDTRGVRTAEVRRLFPRFVARFHSVTLAPPIARRLAPRRPTTARLFQAVPFLCLHRLAFLERSTS